MALDGGEGALFFGYLTDRFGRKKLFLARLAVHPRPQRPGRGARSRSASATACWVVVFFFASAGARAAYLTGSENFPMETRAMALAFFFHRRRGP